MKAEQMFIGSIIRDSIVIKLYESAAYTPSDCHKTDFIAKNMIPGINHRRLSSLVLLKIYPNIFLRELGRVISLYVYVNK